MRIEHSHLCTSNATLCAVENMRDHLQEYTHHSDELPADMTPLQTLELVQEWARSYQDNGDVTCTCAVDTMKRYDADLRQLRKALNGHLAEKAQARIAEVTALRNELKAHLAGVR